MELTDRHVVVTGAGSGIGYACARRFAAEGARVVVADVNFEPVKALADEIGGLATQTDVSREAEITELVARAAKPTARSICSSQTPAWAVPAAARRHLTTSSSARGRSTSWPTSGRRARCCPNARAR